MKASSSAASSLRAARTGSMSSSGSIRTAR